MVAGMLALGLLSAGAGNYVYQHVDPWSAKLGPWSIPTGQRAATITSLPPAPPQGEPITVPGVLKLVNATGPVVTADQADAIVRAWWPIHEQALASNNMIATDQLESGGLQQLTDGATLDLIGRRLTWRSVRDLIDLRLFLPRQDAYPADFLAIVDTTPYATDHSHPAGTKVVEFLVFRRKGASDSWKAALKTDGYLAGWPPSVFPTTAVGSAYERPPQGAFTVAPFELPGALASYWTSAYRSGTPPPGSPFATATFTNLSGDAIYRDRLAWEKLTGLRQDVTYFVDAADPTYQFAVNGSYVAVCFTVRMVSRTKSASGATLHQDAARNNYGGRLPPGEYRSLIAHGLHQTCVYVPSIDRGGPLVVDRVGGGDYGEVPG